MTPLHLVTRAPWYVANDAHAKDHSDASEARNGSLAMGPMGRMGRMGRTEEFHSKLRWAPGGCV